MVEGGKDAADALDLLTQVADAAGVASALFSARWPPNTPVTSSSPVISSRDVRRCTRRVVCLPEAPARCSCLA